MYHFSDILIAAHNSNTHVQTLSVIFMINADLSQRQTSYDLINLLLARERCFGATIL